MTEIRIRKLFDGNVTGMTFVTLKQIENGLVEYSEDHFPTKKSVYPFHTAVTVITAKEANTIYAELKKYARPYFRTSEDDIFSPLKNWKYGAR